MGGSRPFWELEGYVTGLGKWKSREEIIIIVGELRRPPLALVLPAKNSVDETL